MIRRGDVYRHRLGRHFVVVSTARLNEVGAVIVAEIHDEVPSGMQGMLAVALGPDEPLAGAVLTWRVNWLAGDRLGEFVGRLSAEVMEHVDMALRTAMDL
ncbi:type II toxin-antitoxin system PemK/MazF family toxin [Catenuloplanes indicus]|uniref:mRNA-degrading endonuclease toxin of MazEF toxin-antitoxin module n=1 Tax=Catenuloplanes indicus TaxID=137267 RepID=A0AAE3W9A3_9ACTN|nr:type II toxin-antitoxin system PemK/MazF family toxin [Catenuloplanes indicus]MDQ0371652.1 mRNA-degrading endonuclease toxin of MazEF toxin-antitoxin module [Catenuloplanes indicus]